MASAHGHASAAPSASVRGSSERVRARREGLQRSGRARAQCVQSAMPGVQVMRAQCYMYGCVLPVCTAVSVHECVRACVRG